MEAKNCSHWFIPLVVGGGLLLMNVLRPAMLSAQTAQPANAAPATVNDGPVLEPEKSNVPRVVHKDGPTLPSSPPQVIQAGGQVPQVGSDNRVVHKDGPALPPSPPQVIQAGGQGPQVGPDERLTLPQLLPTDRVPPLLPAPPVEQGEKALPINLPTALRLTNDNAWDIIIAQQQLRIAEAELLAAKVLWVPDILGGFDWTHHDGPVQDISTGQANNNSHSSLYTGAAPEAIFNVTDAIFAPLAARQVVRAQDANIQTARNDTSTAMAIAYITAIEAKAELAGALDVDRRAAQMVKTALSMVTEPGGGGGGLIPELEVNRVRAAKASFEEQVETARQHWRDASAEVARIARLEPTVVLQPQEPPFLKIRLVAPSATPDELLPIAIATRPELTFQEALAQAARRNLQEERWRPFMPNVVVRGGGTTPPYPFAAGGFSTGQGGSLGSMTGRDDWDIEAVWVLHNAGLGNVALIRQRKAQYDLARSEEYRFRDIVTKEVTQAWVDVRSAERRALQAEQELQQAELSATRNVRDMHEVKRPGGNINLLVVRPLEVVAALQSLESAYVDYFGAIADFNRAQFELYRAMGSPAQYLEGHNGICGAPITDAKAPAPPPGPAPANPAAQAKP